MILPVDTVFGLAAFCLGLAGVADVGAVAACDRSFPGVALGFFDRSCVWRAGILSDRIERDLRQQLSGTT